MEGEFMSIWSRRLAEEIARTLGYFDLSEEERLREGRGKTKVADCLDAMTETFRYLPAEQVNWTTNLARFLRERETGTRPPGWVGAKLQEIYAYMLFLRGRHGYEQPIDESDVWTREEELEFSRASIERRLAREGEEERDGLEGR
jgi:hypothetical protein